MEKIDLKEYLMEVVFRKLDAELKDYKATMFLLKAQDVFNYAYEIDSYINIYETLIVKVENLELAQLLGLLNIPNILSFFYDRWLDFEDSRAEEMEIAISEIIKNRKVIGNIVEQEL